MKTKQYLAWGGESGDEFAIITANDIGRELENRHYSNVTTWSRFALLDASRRTNPAKPVTIERAGEEYTDEDDYMHAGWKIVGPRGGLIDTFSTRIDGRA